LLFFVSYSMRIAFTLSSQARLSASVRVSAAPASCTAVGVVPGCSLLDLVTDLHDWAVLIK